MNFLDISTSKSEPKPQCLYHFDSEMRFAPQPPALCQQFTCQKCSEHGVLLVFGLQSVLRAKRRARFGHLNVQKSSKPEVFCAFWLPNVLRTSAACNFWSLIWRFREPTFFHLRSHKSLEKHSVLRFFYLLGHLHLLSSDSFSALLSSALLFSNSSYLCCFICPYCRKFDF